MLEHGCSEYRRDAEVLLTGRITTAFERAFRFSAQTRLFELLLLIPANGEFRHRIDTK